MKWLIVAFGGRKEDVEHMRHFLEHYDTTITVFGAGSCPEKDFLSAVAECEYCIWLGDTEGAGQEGGVEACPAELSFAFGYVLGKDMPVFCVRKEGARHWHQSPLTTNEYHEYTSCSDLLSVLE
ncbi:MAG: hypothetical protein IJ441_07310, partial [Spirochaetaceae bacterium]|nr:hypothetical protein [Spirochaetaceae bacterium]